MARQFIVPLQDASIYAQFATRNAGFDEILEVGKSTGNTGSIRALLQFDTAKISLESGSGQAPLTSTFFLNMRLANANHFQRSQSIEFYQISESWDEGTGFFLQDLENPKDGVTQKIKVVNDVTWSLEGGTTGSLVATNTFDWKPADIRLDITNAVRAWITGSLNNGLLIKIPTADEDNVRVLSNVRFFSRNTHTIYPPTIEAVWNTQTMSIGPSALELAPDEIELFVTNLKQSIPTGSTQRIRFGVREESPIRSFTDTFRFSNKFFLPSSSYIGVQDAATSAFIVPFDTGSLISTDSTGSYFDLKIENMFINRTYKVLVKVQKPWGGEVVDTGQTFKVI